ncbi:MAG: GTP pyrophosphokinase [Bacteroidetes bacterium ADurb.BinA395]|nr:MAG: GTP pyrophosphokinase [Bacteroidetes bacterium ADurb.BinA395]
MDNWLKTIKEVLEHPDTDAINFLETFKLTLFASEIFVFTPKGEIKTIAQGATALDFAFMIHSDLGMHCIGAKVNHKLVPLNHRLQSGDQVEILTSQKQTPKEEWLNYVTTAKARSKILELLKKEEKNIAAEGQKMIENALAEINLPASNENIMKILQHYNLTQRNELYVQAGKGALNLDDIKKVIFKQKTQNVFSKYLKIPFIGSSSSDNKEIIIPTQGIDRKATLKLTEENTGKIFKLAECCHPIPGDDVLGYLDENGIIYIHKRQCPVALKLKSNFGERILSAEWATHKILSFEETIEIKGIDRKGILIEILKVISEAYGVNISKINIETESGIFIGKFQVLVHDTEELNNMCENLTKIPEVQSVQRIEQTNLQPQEQKT